MRFGKRVLEQVIKMQGCCNQRELRQFEQIHLIKCFHLHRQYNFLLI
jgi:hypothetical protein